MKTLSSTGGGVRTPEPCEKCRTPVMRFYPPMGSPECGACFQIRIKEYIELAKNLRK